MLKVAYVNFWPQDQYNVQDYWLFNFIKNNIDPNAILVSLTNNISIDILIASCFGDISIIKNINARVKLFFYGENLNKLQPYNNIKLLQNNFDLIIGFKYTNMNEKLIRLPLWLTYYPFYKYEDDNNILKYLQESYNKNFNLENKHNVASLVANHDNNGVRSMILSEISNYMQVICPGKFNRNINPIGPTCKDKINFIKQTKFNICPENSEFEGYFTEKIFESLEAGCIPIYWAIDKPERNILNENCYLWFDLHNTQKRKNDIFNMIVNYEKQRNINLFNPDAKNEIEMMYDNLKNSILNILLKQ
jgi:hypothetical protein